ncbi:MAG: glycosyltransferase family 39 protein [Burkholderiales bacterium]
MTLALTPRERRLLWGVLGLAVVVRVATLGAYPLLDPSESRYAEIARKMVETGNWLTPQFAYGVPFWGKPPLSFWLTALSFSVLGVSEFAARLPSFLLTAATGWVVWRMAARHAGRDAALLATTVFATTGLVFISAGSVLTDLALMFGTTLAMAGFWEAVAAADRRRLAGNAMFFAGLAVGLLAKGPIGVVLSGVPIGAWVLLQRAWGPAWHRVHWIAGTALAACVVVPWYVAAERATPGFLQYFIVGEHWQRFTQPGWTGDLYGTGHAWPRGSIWLFWLAAALPWSIVFLDWAVRCAWTPRATLAARTADPFWRYLVAWTLAPMLFFTLSRNVLPSYVLPGLPAFALLVACGPFAAGEGRPIDRAERRGLVAAALFACGFAVAVLVLHDRLEREYAQRGLVRAYAAARGGGDGRLIYYGDTPVSAEFYSGGKAQRVANIAALQAYLADLPLDYFAVRESDLAGVPGDERARLEPLGRFGEFGLYRERPAAR